MSDLDAVPVRRPYWPFKKKVHWTYLLVAVIGVVSLNLILYLVYNRVRGVALGDLDLLGAPSSQSFEVELKPGDEIFVRLTDLKVEVDTPPDSPWPDQKGAQRALRESALTIEMRIVGDATAESLRSTCPVYRDGGGMHPVDKRDGGLARRPAIFGVGSGPVLDGCALKISAGGRYSVHAQTNWGSGLRVQTAKIQVRKGDK